jgi:hypothetical protein
MAEAALPALGESLMAESFVAAAPEMFIAPEAMGAEFGTEALFSGLGAEGFGGLSALGSEFGTEALLSGAGETVPTLGEGIAQNVTSGGLGAGEAGINEAMVSAQQAEATNTLNQLTNAFENAPEVVEGIKSAYPATELATTELTPEMLNQEAQGLEQASRFSNTTNASFPQTSPNVTQSAMNNPAAQAGSAMNTPYQSYDPVQEQLAQVPGGRLPPGMTGSSAPLTEPSALESGFNKALNYVKENPFSAASMGYSAMKLLGGDKKQEEAPAGYNGILSKYKMSPNFQGRQANPQDFQYTPRVYAEGGIASFKSGGKSDSLDPTGGSKLAMDYYESMQRQQAKDMPSTRSDMGIYYDLDPDTRYLDPVTAAQVRMAKINKRANIQAANMKRPTPMGQINLTPPGVKTAAPASSLDPETMAAHGGIMHSSLGGYATGGNPRLLKGPGDGMSDNIPATIAGKQPARLADGEFVIPADVVSHLGNGSTEAGAKVLHAMMTKVRKERTGNPKQGKQINPRKFVPT